MPNTQNTKPKAKKRTNKKQVRQPQVPGGTTRNSNYVRQPVGYDSVSERYGAEKMRSLVPLQELRNLGITKSGLEWAIEHMDPNGSHISSPGCPDLATGARHLHPQRMSIKIAAPKSLGEAKNLGTWDLMIVVFPFPDMYMATFTKPSVQQWDQNKCLSELTANLNNPDQEEEQPSSAWYVPEYLPSGAYPLITADKMRLLSRGITTEPIGPAMYRSGRVTSGQYPISAIHQTYARLDNNDSPPTIQGANVVNRNRVIMKFPTFDDPATALISTDTLAREASADGGDYNVLRYSTPTGVPKLRSTLEAGEMCFLRHDDDSVNNIADGGYHSSHHVTFNDDMNIAVVVYEGLNKEEVIRVKVMGTAEIAPKTGSNLATLTKVVPQSDLQAIKLVADITNQLPHSYPADYNDLGGIFGAIGNALKKIAMPVAGAIKDLGIPIASPVAGIVHTLGSHFGWG